MTTTARHFEVFIVSKTNGQTTYLPAGRARENRDGSLNVYLDALPVSGQLHLRPPLVPTDVRIPVAPHVSTLNMKPAPHTVVYPLFTGDTLDGWAHQCPGKGPGEATANQVHVLTCICGQIRPPLEVLRDLHIEARRAPEAPIPRLTTAPYVAPDSPAHCTKDPKCWRRHGHEGDCDTELPF